MSYTVCDVSLLCVLCCLIQCDVCGVYVYLCVVYGACVVWTVFCMFFVFIVCIVTAVLCVCVCCICVCCVFQIALAVFGGVHGVCHMCVFLWRV